MGAAQSLTFPFSAEIDLIRDLVSKNTSEDGLTIESDQVTILEDRLELISKAVALLEREIAVYRINETDNVFAGMLDDLAGEFLKEESAKLDTPTDNLVFPDFGQKGGK